MMAIHLERLVTDEFYHASEEPSTRDEELPRWKGKGKAVAAPNVVPSTPLTPSTPESSQNSPIENEVDWTKYEPPEGLLDIAGVERDDIRRILKESINRVKAKIVEEEEARKAILEAEKLRREAENEKEVVTETATEESAPRTSDETDAIQKEPSTPKYYNVDPATFAGVKLIIGADGLLRPAPPPKSKKRSFMGLIRRLNNTDKAESSAQGAVRNKLTTLNTRSAVGLVKKAVGGNSPRSSTASSVVEETIECVSCLDDFEPKSVIKAPCHSYCEPCFHRLVRTACENEQQWPPKCCLNDIPEETIISNSGPELRKEYREKAKEWSVPIGDRLYCPHRNCGLFIPPGQIKRGQDTVRCSAGHRMCILCRGSQHPNNTACPQDRDLQQTETLAEEEGWKRCPGCRAYVEHRDACQHITCRCGAQFCYVCVAPWRTCRCTMDQLHELKTAAATRRRDRERRAELEDAETAEAIRLVDEYVREEARKAELLRAERARRAHEERRLALVARLRREYARRAAVEARYRELRAALATLHDGQRVLVVCAHGRGDSVRAHAAAVAGEGMRAAHAERRRRVLGAAGARVAEHEAALRDEYGARVRAERAIEDGYEAELVAYWSRWKEGRRASNTSSISSGSSDHGQGSQDDDDNEDQEASPASLVVPEVEAAMRDLRKKMDRGFRAWRLWARETLAQHRQRAQEEVAAELQHLEEAEKQLTAAQAEAEATAERRKAAEIRWVDVVVQERETMLREGEDRELDGDGDSEYEGEDLEVLLAESQELGVELTGGDEIVVAA